MSVVFWGHHKCCPRALTSVTAGAVYKCHCGKFWVYSWADYWTPLRWWHFRAKATLQSIGEDYQSPSTANQAHSASKKPSNSPTSTYTGTSHSYDHKPRRPTVSDPVLEAARRAMKEVHDWPHPNYDLKVAAREALIPIREWYAGFYLTLPKFETLIYSSDELRELKR